MPTLVIRSPDGTEQEQPLAQELAVGRGEGNDLVLLEGGVSRKHARFFVDSGQVMVEDAGSANGTWVDGAKIEGATAVGPRTQVVIGDYEISLRGGVKAAAGAGDKLAVRPKGNDRPTTTRPAVKSQAKPTKMVPVVSGGAASQALAQRSRPKARAAGPVLRGLTGPWLNKTFALQGTMTVGRVAGVEIQLDDDSVSRRHAEVSVTADATVLRDLGSANGTTVNGNPLSGEVALNPGDIVQFGLVEVTYETPDVVALSQGGGRLPVRSRPAASGQSPRLPRWLVVAGVVVLLAGGAAVVRLLVKPGGSSTTPVGSIKKPVAPTVEDYLIEARGYANPGSGEPNWERALASVEKALVLEPIHEEANQLKRQYTREKACSDNFEKGRRSMKMQRGEEALEAFASIKSDCQIFFKVKPILQEVIDAARKRTEDDCKTYSANGNLKEAYPRCQKYMELTCQGLKPDELYPPVTATLNVSRPMKKNDWRPTNKMYLNFLRAKEKVDPKAGPWVCPQIEILRPPPPPVDQSSKVRALVSQRLPDKELVDAVMLYWNGKVTEAHNLLLRVKERSEKASIHALAESLRTDIDNADAFAKEGGRLVEDPDQAKQPFLDALALDEQILFGATLKERSPEEREAAIEGMKSVTRRTIQQEMAKWAYQRGKFWGERQDARKACHFFKLGFSFFKGDTTLLQAVNNGCTVNAKVELQRAVDCEGLERADEFAVDGDGVHEEVLRRKEQMKCP